MVPNNLSPICCLAEHSKETSYPILAMLLLSSLTVKLSRFNSLLWSMAWVLTDHEQNRGNASNRKSAHHTFKSREHMFELFQSKDQGHAYMCVITEKNNFGSSMLQLCPPPSILEPWPPPVNNIIMSSEEEIQPRVRLFKCNQTDGVVPLQVLRAGYF